MLGVDEHHQEIDTIIAKFSEHWSLERMPVVDRALLRIGTYELAWCPDVPTAVAITEAVESGGLERLLVVDLVRAGMRA